MSVLHYKCDNEEDTQRLGAGLARCLPDGTCVALIGTLGAGKTRLVQAVAAAIGIDPTDVTSPTFVLCQRYEGTRTIFHMDAYRLHDLDEFFELGVDEYFESSGLSFVEWADRVRQGMPRNCLEVVIQITGPTSRDVTLTTNDDAQGSVLDCIARDLASARRVNRG